MTVGALNDCGCKGEWLYEHVPGCCFGPMNSAKIPEVDRVGDGPTPEVVRAAYAFWMDARTRSQNEIHKLREMCRHKNTSISTREDDLIGNVTTVNCRDCGKFLGDK